MPQYTLQVVVNSVPQTTVYTLNVTGSSASGVNVKYKATGDNGWTDFGATTGNTVTYTPASGKNGTPANPQPGDQLTLTGTLGAAPNTIYSLEGDATYSTGEGYLREGGLTGDEGDWAAAPSN